jgi:hypothetical protein
MSFDFYRADDGAIRYGDVARFSFTATGHRAHKVVFSHHSWDRVEEPIPPPRE